MPPLTPPRPLVSHTRRLSAIYLPAFCDAAVEPSPAGATVEVRSDHAPMVKVSLERPSARDCLDRIVLVAHGDAIRLPRRGHETCDPYLFRMAQAIKCGFRSNVLPPRNYLESLARPLAAHLERYYTTRTRQRERLGLSERRLDRALAFIDENLFEDFPIEALAEAAWLSPFHFQRMFKRSIGIAPQAFVTRRRVAEAGLLLGSTVLPIAEVARRVGYANQGHFAMLFRRLAGITPSQYRCLAGRGAAPELPGQASRRSPGH